MSDFKVTFLNWVETALSSEIPENVIAFAFNLYETEQQGLSWFSVELIGSSEFDANNSDWACEEVFVSCPRRLEIPLEFSGKTWDVCLNHMSHYAREMLMQSHPSLDKLNAAKGVGIGFVDGDLILISSKVIS